MALIPAGPAFLSDLAARLPEGTLAAVEPKFLTEPRGRWQGVGAAVARPRRVDEVATIVRTCAAASDRGRPSTRSTTAASAPVRSTAAATTNRAATVIIPSLLMPLRASAGVITPAASRSTQPP